MNFCEFIPQGLALMDKIQHQSPALEHIEIRLLESNDQDGSVLSPLDFKVAP